MQLLVDPERRAVYVLSRLAARQPGTGNPPPSPKRFEVSWAAQMTTADVETCRAMESESAGIPDMGSLGSFEASGEIVNASAGSADPAFVRHNGCKRSVLGQVRKSLKIRPERLQNQALLGLSGGKSALRLIFRCLLAPPGPLPGAPGALRRQKWA